ncbi:shikimate kinase [Arthrobacter sp. Hiyo4]|nr:shikimate kinase [Arthrobacter sp. Hiyo4]
MARWSALFITRKPVYERLANLVVDVRQGSVSELGHRLEVALRDYAAAKQEVEN